MEDQTEKKDFLDMTFRDVMKMGFRAGYSFNIALDRMESNYRLIEGLDLDPDTKRGYLKGLERQYLELLKTSNRYGQNKDPRVLALVERNKELKRRFDPSTKELEQKVEEQQQGRSEQSILFKLRRDGSMKEDEFVIDVDSQPVETPFDPDAPKYPSDNSGNSSQY